MVQKIFPDPFLKNHNYVSVSIVKSFTVWLWVLSKYIGTKLQTNSFYSYKAFLKITLSFQSSVFFLQDQQVKTGTGISRDQKELSRWNKSIFLYHF